MPCASPRGYWQYQQQLQIGRINGAASARALFPGSMLFNEILIPANGPRVYIPRVINSAHSLDVVYRYCCEQHTDDLLSGALLLDVGDCFTDSLLPLLNTVIEQYETVSRVIVLGCDSNRLIQGLKSRKQVVSMPVDWSSSYSQHRIYRQVQHTAFFDTLRVMDAAFTGCSCSAYFSPLVVKNKAYFYWINTLNRSTQCTVYDHELCIVEGNDKVDYPFLIARNNTSEFQRMAAIASKSNLESVTAEVLPIDMILDNSSPVIVAGERKSATQKIRSQQTAIARKLVKLKEDPVAFLADSKINLLRNIARTIDSSSKAK